MTSAGAWDGKLPSRGGRQARHPPQAPAQREGESRARGGQPPGAELDREGVQMSRPAASSMAACARRPSCWSCWAKKSPARSTATCRRGLEKSDAGDRRTGIHRPADRAERAGRILSSDLTQIIWPRAAPTTPKTSGEGFWRGRRTGAAEPGFPCRRDERQQAGFAAEVRSAATGEVSRKRASPDHRV